MAHIRVSVTVPSASVGSNLADFPVYVDLSTLPACFWTNLAYDDGRDIRVRTAAGAEIPFDLVRIDALNQTGALFAKLSLSSSADTTFYIHGGATAYTAVAPGAANGRNAVWSDYHRVFFFTPEDGNADHTGNGTAAVPTGNVSAFIQDDISGETNSHQGVAWDGTHYYTTDTNALYKWDAGWNLVATNADPVGDVAADVGVAILNHAGDPEVRSGVIYIGIQYWDNTGAGSASDPYIARFNASDLSYISAVSLAAPDAISSLCYVSEEDAFYAVSYLDGSTLWKFNRATLAAEGTVALSTTIPYLNGITWWNQRFWLASDGTARWNNAGFENKRLFAATLTGTVADQPALRYNATAINAQDYVEGLGHTDDALLLVRSTAAVNSGHVFSLTPVALEASGGLVLDDSDHTDAISTAIGYLNATGLTRYTTWTMRITVNVNFGASTMNFINYGTAGSGDDTKRAAVGWRQATNQIGLWNSTDSWLNRVAVVASNTTYRTHSTHQGTTERKFYTDASAVTDSGCAERPAAGADALFIGVEDATIQNTLDGRLGFVYLRASVLTADWIAAEHDNLTAPGTFYTMGGTCETLSLQGSAVFGVNTTVRATRAIAFGLDGATNVHSTAGQFKVFGDADVTGALTEAGVDVATLPIDLASDVTGDLPLANLAQPSGPSLLLGSGSGSPAGDWEEITPGDNLEIVGAAIQVVPPTQASILFGRGDGSPVGAWEEITLGTDLSMSGTTLNATGGGATTLDELTDVALGSPISDGDVLTYDTGTGSWSNAAPTGGAVGDLLDVAFTRKAADESVTSSAVLQSDDHLNQAIGANETWTLRWVLFVEGATAGDFNFALNVPAGAAGWMSGRRLTTTATTATDAMATSATTDLTDTGVRSAGLAGAGTYVLITVEAVVVNGANAGTITLRWCQGSSSGTATTVKANSFLIAQRFA